MALKDSYGREIDQVLFEGNSYVKKVVLNRPTKLNCINYSMFCLLWKKLKEFENDSTVKLVILKGNGKSIFSAGGDLKSFYKLIIEGHWSFATRIYTKMLMVCHLLATYKKPAVALVDGIVIGFGAGMSMYTPYKIVTENTVFSMPEASSGLFPDAGASHFLSRLPGYLGEYVGLAGAKLRGTEMIACGLATHFVLSKDIRMLESSLEGITSSDTNAMSQLISQFSQETSIKQDENSYYHRLEIINKCFSRETVEDILLALEEEAEHGNQNWIVDAIKFMKSACPTSLKLALKSIKKGRYENLEQCYVRDHLMGSHILRGTMSNDIFEGIRGLLVDRNIKPKWEPSKLELVTSERVEKFFTTVDDDDWEPLQLRPAVVNVPVGWMRSNL